MSLSDAELERYARHIVLPQVGGVGQRKLKAASVAVIGAGGIGSAVIPALAGAGVGRLTIIDDDVVELANLHRQPLFRERDVGYPKAELAAQFVQRLNHFVDGAAGAGSGSMRTMRRQLLAGHDLVIDGSDNFATRLAVSDACVALGIPLRFRRRGAVPGAGRPVPRPSPAIAASSAMRSMPRIATIAPSSVCLAR